MTQEKCERAVEALQKSGFRASHVQGAPDDHGVWIDSVWNDALEIQLQLPHPRRRN